MGFLDVIALALSKKFTKATVEGMGAIKGAACQIQSSSKVSGVNTVVFRWEDNEGNVHNSQMVVNDGADGATGPQGQQGVQGEKGDKGDKGDTGDTGATGTAATIQVGNVTSGESANVTNSGTTQAAVFNFTLPKGDKGDTGPKGDDGQDGKSFEIKAQYATYADLIAAHPTGSPGDAYFVGVGTSPDLYTWLTDDQVWYNNGPIAGVKGDKGDKGDAGYSPTATVSKVGDTATIEITDQNGTTRATVKDGTNGQDGQDGQDGADGITPSITATATVDDNTGTPSVNVTRTGTDVSPVFAFAFANLKGAKGDKGDTGSAGAKGDTGATGATGNGIASITKTTTSGLVDTYTITYTDGTTDTFTVTNGENGEDARKLANGTYEGVDLTVKFADEIANFSDEWAWIQDRLDNNNLDDLNIFDYIPVKIGTENHKAQIAGIDTYYNTTDVPVGHHIDWITKDCYGTTVQWNTTNNNNGTSAEASPFLASNLNAWLNSTLYGLLESKLKAVIKTKRMLLPTRYTAGSTLTDDNSWAWKSTGNLWVPLETEIFENLQWSTKGFGEGQNVQYPIFKNSYKARIKGAGPGGARASWWGASASSGNSTSACHVYTGGRADHDSASTALCAPLCFRTMASA